ncbi:hypothetical protein MMC25_004671 [Agyrium rufum]|nr:hypothetical protein [Agyrium rufum]
MSTPTLINLPPPPSDPVTPSDFGPGTPNSTTTSLSALSTTAIKDGHQGHAPPHAHNHYPLASSMQTLDAERADRISRLAGLERVASLRGVVANSNANNTPYGGGGMGYNNNNNNNNNNNVSGGGSPFQQQLGQGPGYFDGTQGANFKERSTVGSASATGSVVGGRTWASGSDAYDGDKMSEDQDDGEGSSAGLSDEGNASLVGFGEGAESTVSGPISSSTPSGRMSGLVGGGAGGSAQGATGQRTNSGFTSPSGRGSQAGYYPREGGSPMQGLQMGDRDRDRKARMTGQENAERIVRERMGQGGEVI